MTTCTLNGQIVECPAFLNILGPVMPFIFLALFVIMIVAMWKVFTKANQPGWAAIVPIYNFIVLLQIVRKPTWWVILAFIPFVNFVIIFIVMYELAKVFGKGIGFMFGLILLPFVFYPILGFGKAQYMPAQTPTAQI